MTTKNVLYTKTKKHSVGIDIDLHIATSSALQFFERGVSVFISPQDKRAAPYVIVEGTLGKCYSKEHIRKRFEKSDLPTTSGDFLLITPLCYFHGSNR